MSTSKSPPLQLLDILKDSASSECRHEVAYLGPENECTESARHWNGCTKNKEHKSFIPIGEFGLNHLPKRLQREGFVAFIKLCADLTVRLRVYFYTDSDPCANGGTSTKTIGGQRVGTGYVYKVEPTFGPCSSCTECEDRDQCQGQVVSWIFYISTAKHVVDDDTEPETVCVDFFHDSPQSAHDGTMKILKGSKVVEKEATHDLCKFTCVCHDGELAQMMIDKLEETKRLEDSLSKWLVSLRPDPHILVSHAHGMPKHVTVGDLAEWELDSDMYTYTTDSCPGSSGAHMVGWGGGMRYAVIHCQAGKDGGPNKGFFSLL